MNPRRTTILAIASLVIAFSSVGFTYYQYSVSNQTISSIHERDLSSFLQLLQQNGTYPSSDYFSSSYNSINTTAIYNYAYRSVVTVNGLQPQPSASYGTTYKQVLGSGFVVEYDNSYYILTNYHVVQNDVNISITFSDGDGFAAVTVGTDPYVDLAVLSASSAPVTEYRALTLQSSSALRVGQSTVAIGSPYGLSGSMTEGIISQVGRTIQGGTAGNYSISNVIQISTPINPGNSGGPLLDSYGRVVGITTAIVSGSQGIGFAVPSESLLRELPILVSTGLYNLHPYLGISMVDLNYDLAQAIGSNVTYGVLVQTVDPKGPASGAGLKGGTALKIVDRSQFYAGGDIITSINGSRIQNGDALSSWLEQHALPGEAVELGVIRASSNMILYVTLGVRPLLS